MVVNFQTRCQNKQLLYMMCHQCSCVLQQLKEGNLMQMHRIWSDYGVDCTGESFVYHCSYCTTDYAFTIFEKRSNESSPMQNTAICARVYTPRRLF